MHLIPVCLLTIETKEAVIKIRRVVSIELSRGGNALGTTATVLLHANAFYNNQQIDLSKYIERGDKVTLDLGFDSRLVRELTGYVSKVKPTLPLELDLEDGFFQLRRKSVKGQYKSVSLKALLKSILPSGLKFEAADIQIGNLTIEPTNVADVLARLHKDHNIQFWFDPQGKLIAGRLNSHRQSGLPVYSYKQGQSLVKSDLEYIKAEDLKIKINGINHLPKNKKEKYSLGDAGGDQYDRNYYNLSSADFKKAVRRDLQAYKVDGFKGSFTALGLPSIQPGDIVAVEGVPYSQVNNLKAFSDQITVKFDSAGYFREINVGGKAIGR